MDSGFRRNDEEEERIAPQDREVPLGAAGHEEVLADRIELRARSILPPAARAGGH